MSTRDEMIAAVALLLNECADPFDRQAMSLYRSLAEEALAPFLPDEDGTPAGFEVYAYSHEWVDGPELRLTGRGGLFDVDHPVVPLYRRIRDPKESGNG